MATVDEMKQAFVAAHSAGDTASAQRLAAAIQSQQSSPQQEGPKKQGALVSGLQGFYGNIANVAGFPVDIMNLPFQGVEKLTGLNVASDTPVGGSRWLRQAMRGFDKVEGWPKYTYDSMNDLHPSDRKWAVGGEVLGGSVLPAAAPFAYARAGAAAPRLLAGAVEAAKRAPGRFAATEAGMALGAAQGGVIAEMADPGNENARFAGELIGSVVNPTQAVRTAAGAVRAPINAVATNFTRAGRENAASRVLKETLEKTGENPNAVAEALRFPDEFGLDLTAGQRTGSPGLLAVERRLANMDPQFAARMESRPTGARTELLRQGERVIGTGNPSELTAAMRQRLGQTLGNIRNVRGEAEIAALRGRQQIGEVAPADMASASANARNVLGDALENARAQESNLWSTVPRDATIEPVNVLAARETIRSRLLPNEAMPQPIETFTASLADQPSATSGDLLRLRSRALSRARQATAQGDFDLSNQMGTIAEGALDDLGGLSDEARTFSRNLNQRFTQGFAGDALSRDATGGPRIEPEAVLPRAFGSGGSLGEVRMRQLSEAADFGGQGAPMLSQQDTFLRGAVQSVIDPQTGRVNPTKLAAWQRQNATLLQRFPQLRSDLGTAESAQRTFERVEAITDKATRNANKTLVARIAGVDNPVSEVGRILSPKNADRVSQYSSIARSAQNAGPEAVAGLRSSTLESVFRNATDQAGNFNFEVLAQQLLNKGPSGRDQSLLEMMRATGVMDAAADNRMRAIINRATSLNNALRTPAGIKTLVDDPDALTDFLTRTVGANVGARLGGGGGATLVAASAGSKMMRKYFEKLPANKVQDVLVEAAENPHFMAMLLQKPKTEKQARALMQQMNGFLYGAGIALIQDDTQEKRPLANSLDAYGR